MPIKSSDRFIYTSKQCFPSLDANPARRQDLISKGCYSLGLSKSRKPCALILYIQDSAILLLAIVGIEEWDLANRASSFSKSFTFEVEGGRVEDAAVVPNSEIILLPANPSLNVMIIRQNGIEEVQDQL